MKKYKVSYLLPDKRRWRYTGIYGVDNFETFAKRWFDSDKLDNYQGFRFIDIDTKKVVFEILK